MVTFKVIQKDKEKIQINRIEIIQMSRSAIIRLILFLMFIGALVLKTYFDRVQILQNLKIVEGRFSGFSGGGRNQALYFDFIFFSRA